MSQAEWWFTSYIETKPRADGQFYRVTKYSDGRVEEIALPSPMPDGPPACY